MPRDQGILRTFEVADDAMQGVVGYWLYGNACRQAANDIGIQSFLPEEFPLTHRWPRNYDRSDLTRAMNDLYEPYHSRVALISIIGVFEVAIKGFMQRLRAAGKCEKPAPDSYRQKLEWAFKVALQSTHGSQKVINRIPDLCLGIDNARRIRNLWMHSNGLFDVRYEEDGIRVAGREPVIEEAFRRFRDSGGQVPVVMDPTSFLDMSKSHIEVLHHIHNVIQRIHYGHSKPYDYREAGKRIEWHRLLIGK
ncbi:hypothetical protein ACFLSF_01785 [Candidatus Bipolaricaulota bacterium]